MTSQKNHSIENRFEELALDPQIPDLTPNPSSSNVQGSSNQKSNDQTQIDDVGRPDALDDPIKLLLSTADALKQEGNKNFTQKRWTDALNKYAEAIMTLPPSPSSQEAPPDVDIDAISSDDDEITKPTAAKAQPSQKSKSDLGHQQSSIPKLDPQIHQLISVLHANSAACHLKLEDWQSAIKSCSASLKENPSYAKALQRRAQANEKLGTWSSLQAALDDYNTLEKLPDVNAILRREIKQSQLRLPPLIAQRSESEKAEMMTKLKDLGNTVLGKFGMSTDNFKFTPNESGGYSMSFQR
ncbi:hypothetical protein O181_046513 [Austropuccinia psidii MF-1]|uniref:Tetratricopeptide repeat protein 1 n=1 Tax=Austropuccinia psidii MF-1 TaxID=1389203 RepID=A0A9Q3HIM1_9BASI|nr:hypothetical protein [Austropuccinia psidii MF-1]